MKRKLFFLFFVGYLIPGMNIFAQNLDQSTIESKSEGVTCDVHKNNIGKILFGKKRIRRTIMNSPDTYQETFLLTDLIYGRAFLEKTLAGTLVDEGGSQHVNEKKGATYVFALITADGAEFMPNNVPIYITELESMDDGKYVTTVQLPIFSDPTDFEQRVLNTNQMQGFNSLSVGTHKMVVTAYAGEYGVSKSAHPVAVGEFNLKIEEGKKLSIGKSFESVQPGMSSSTLEKSFLSSISKVCGDWGTALSVKIKDGDWTIVRNSYGTILNRTIDVYSLVKSTDGICRIITYHVAQNYSGSSYSSSNIVTGPASREFCDCPK